MALGFTACDDTSDLGVEQKNPQEAIMQLDGLTTEFGEALTGDAINLSEYVNIAALNPAVSGTPEDKPMPLMKVVEAKDLPADAYVTFMMQMSADDTFANPQELNLTDGAVLGSEFDLAYQELFGKTPEANKVWVRFAAYVVDGNQLSRMGGLNTWLGQKEVTVTPVDLKLIQLAYNFQPYVDGNALEAVAMSASASKHPYDDPEFVAVFNVDGDQVAAGYEWNITGADGTVYYPDTEGKLSTTGVRGKITAIGSYRVVANMLDMTYTLSLAYETLTTPGGGNGWNVESEEWRLTTTDYANYYGYAWLDGEFKIAAGTWDVNWGVGDAEGTLAPGAGNIQVPAAGLYYVKVNLNEKTYSVTPITSIGMIGDFNGWGAQEPMTISDNGKSIKGECTFAEGQGWKFRANDDWGINLGGSLTDLVPDGDNLQAPGNGVYEVELNLSTLPYTATLTKK